MMMMMFVLKIVLQIVPEEVEGLIASGTENLTNHYGALKT